jgi:predicted CoA-substrate-specific enzyme activase
MKTYLGIDVGSISYKFVLIDEKNEVLFWLYKRTEGNPIGAIQQGLRELRKFIKNHNTEIKIDGVASTGSARYLAGVVSGADLIKNEITTHARAVSSFIPDAKTVIEIGGQDSKIIILENKVAVDFAMNLICSAGTGAFLDAQAYRLGVPVEKFGELALSSKTPTVIGSRCSVFAESDMIHKQQIGHKIEDIVAGLCQGLARNYLSGVGKGKRIKPPIIFLGGVSENLGMRRAFEKALDQKIVVPFYNTVMGALGAALLIKEISPAQTKFRGFEVSEKDIRCASFQCRGCPNQCEVIEARIDGKIIARWGDRCAKWSNLNPA